MPLPIHRRLPARTVRHLSLLALGALLLLSACPQTPGGQAARSAPGNGTSSAPPPLEAKGRRLVIWADPLLEKALLGLAEAYGKASAGGSYEVVPTERAVLLRWADSGETGTAAPDVLLFGGNDDYALLRDKGRFDEASARTFAGDRLVVLKPLDTTYTSPTVFDLYKSRFKELAVGDPQGTYVGLITHQALVSDGGLARIQERLVPRADSRELAGVPAGRKDALAITFVSQAGGAQGVEPMLLIDSGLHEAVQYKAAAAAGKGADPAVVALLRWLAEDQATQTALGGYGLLDRASALQQQSAVAGGGVPAAPDQPITPQPEGK